MRPICLFTTSDVMTRNPFGIQRRPENIRFAFEDGDTFYTTGRLERAIADGLRPIVITSRGRLGEHDAWWKALVKDAGGLVFAEHGAAGGKAFTSYCKELVESQLGLIWPTQEWEGEDEPMFWTNGLRTLNEQQREQL